MKKKKEHGSDRPHITWQFLVFRHNEHEIDAATKMAKDLGVDEVAIEPAVIPVHCRQEAERWVPSDPRYQRYNMNELEETWAAQERIQVPGEMTSGNPIQEETTVRRKPDCFWLWTWASIGWNGSVFPCCHVFDSSSDFGTIADKPFKKVWNNEKYRASRRFSSKGEAAGLRTICMKCPAAPNHEKE